jgi:hypothetical protein
MMTTMLFSGKASCLPTAVTPVVYNNLSNGARVIEMTEGSTNFRTWIRLKDGEVINTVNYPSDFIKKKD